MSRAYRVECPRESPLQIFDTTTQLIVLALQARDLSLLEGIGVAEIVDLGLEGRVCSATRLLD